MIKLYNLDKDEIEKYCNKIESEHHNGLRGDYYDYIYYDNDGILAFGDEQGNYAGGIYYVNRDRVFAKKEYLREWLNSIHGNIEEEFKKYLLKWKDKEYSYYLDMKNTLYVLYPNIFNTIEDENPFDF